MNKDVDERIVPNGQYRDALNVQVVTTDSDSSGIGDAGTLQNIKGNLLVATGSSTVYGSNKSKIIGSIADEGNDASYYFIAAPVPLEGMEQLSSTNNTDITEGEINWIDSIVELKNDEDNTLTPVIVDKFAVTAPLANVFTTSGGSITSPSGYRLNGVVGTAGDGYDELVVADGSKYRVGMRIYAKAGTTNLFLENDNPFVKIVKITGNILTLSSKQTADLDTATLFIFLHPERVLEFDYYKDGEFGGTNTVSSINILNDLLMWTDGKHEPKKINIERCKSGTTDLTSHTKLHVKNPLTSQLVSVNTLEYLDDDKKRK